MTTKTNYWFNQDRLISPLRFATTSKFILVLLVLASSVSSLPATPAQTYNGTLTGSTFYCNGEENPDFRPTVTGTWNLIIDPQTPAQLTLNVVRQRSP
jgi:hypothetical protein